MTALPTREARPGPPGRRHPHRHHPTLRAHLTRPLDHSPEVLLALAAVLIVLAGPVRHALGPTGPMLSGLAAALLLGGLVLAAAAAWRLLHLRG